MYFFTFVIGYHLNFVDILHRLSLLITHLSLQEFHDLYITYQL
nr:MAG TPA: hypothetical protein [Bacteriophage sp.]